MGAGGEDDGGTSGPADRSSSTPEIFSSPQNMDDPASKDLIRPPFERYLKP
jgi:hypothetical protein